MKKIGIAVTDPEDWTASSLNNAISEYGMQPVKFSLRDVTSNITSGKIYADNVDLTSLDAVIVRDMGPATGNDNVFRFDILCQLEESGILVVNSPGSIAKAANKYVTSSLFQKKGISTPRTVVTSSQVEAFEILSVFRQAVVKPVFGFKGMDVELINNDGAGVQKLRTLLEMNGLLYIQEFIPHPGRDIRVFVVNNRVAGSIYRIAPEGGWINNLSQGGTAKPCILTPDQEELSIKAARVTGTVFAGVDIIEGDVPYVLEINGTPSGKGIFDACGTDVTVEIALYIKRQVM